MAADPGHLNPAITTASPVHAVADSLFNGLVALDRAGNPVPDLAESWEVTDGPTGPATRVTFRLRDARWHDGTPFTAADVAHTVTHILLRHHARARASLAPVIASIETPDPRTVVFLLRRPHPSLLRQLDVTEAPILPRHLFPGPDPAAEPATNRPVGTGAFRFVSRTRNDRVVTARNPDYFKPALPRAERLVFRVIPEPATALAALSRGEVDYVGRVAPADLARLRETPGITVEAVRGGPGGMNCVMTLGFNLDRPGPAAPGLRRAVALALDRDRMVSRIAFGLGRVPDSPFHGDLAPHALPGVIPRHPDRAAARAALGGIAPAPLTLVAFGAFSRWAELVREDLAAIGLTIRPRLLDPAAMVDTVFARRDFDLTLISYCLGADPEIGLRRMYDSSGIGNVPFANAAAYRSSEADRLLAEAAAEPNTAARAARYHALQRRVAADLPYWWLAETDFAAAWRDGWTGFAPWSGAFAEAASPR